MVTVKVRETYDLHTTRNKMTVIAIHTPKPDIIKANYPGLLLQCVGYRPSSCNVRVACASVLPLDPLGVGTEEGSVSPEDVFNPILYKATSNFGMSQLEARIKYLSQNADSTSIEIVGQSADVDVDSVVSSGVDNFNIYYSLLSDPTGWRHASPMSGLEMKGLHPLVYEVLQNYGDNYPTDSLNIADTNAAMQVPSANGTSRVGLAPTTFRGSAKRMPFLNCTGYSSVFARNPFDAKTNTDETLPGNRELAVPYINVMCGVIIVPPSRLHELFYRMVVEWDIEFTGIRPLTQITDYGSMGILAPMVHYQNYDYSSTKEALTGDPESGLDSDTCMVSSNVEVKKVM